jgi:FecR protein
VIDDDKVVALAREIEFSEPPRAHVEDMRTAVLATIERPPENVRRRRWWLAGGTAVAAAAATMILCSRPKRLPIDHGRVTSIGDAELARMSSRPDEVIRLREGAVQFDVTPLGKGERFRVVVGDAEVEARGTSFTVEAHRDRLASVVVAHGRVEVRADGKVQLLTDNERWDVPKLEAATSQPSPPVVSPAPLDPSPRVVVRAPARLERVAPPAPTAPSGATAAELAFSTGWEALQRNDVSTAATAFDRVLQLDPQAALAEDAAFWRAIALSRARRAELARRAFETFLVEFPRSVRGGEAAAYLGALLLADGDLDGAEAQFRRAMADSSARVRERGRGGLAEIARRR